MPDTGSLAVASSGLYKNASVVAFKGWWFIGSYFTPGSPDSYSDPRLGIFPLLFLISFVSQEDEFTLKLRFGQKDQIFAENV